MLPHIQPFRHKGFANRKLFRDGLNPRVAGEKPRGADILTSFFRSQLSDSRLHQTIRQVERRVWE